MTCDCGEDSTRGLYTQGCRQCSLREIARGPAFFESMRRGAITEGYARQLEALGGNLVDAHAEAKKIYAALLGGAS